MIYVAATLTLLLGLLLGFWGREVINYLRRIWEAVSTLKIAQDKKEQQEKKMSFADPIVNWDELDDQERIDLLN